MSQCISSSQLIWQKMAVALRFQEQYWLVAHRLRVHEPWSFPMRMVVPEQGGDGRGGGGDTVAPRHRARRGRFGWCVQHGRAAIPHDSLLEKRHTQKHDYQNVCRANQHLIPYSIETHQFWIETIYAPTRQVMLNHGTQARQFN